MIETTYVRLEKAAEILNTDIDTLLIAAAEGRVRLYWLLNAVIAAAHGRYEETGYNQDEGPSHTWVMRDCKIMHFMFVPLSAQNAATLLKDSFSIWDENALTPPDSEGTYWIPDNEANGFINITNDWNKITKNAVFMSNEDVRMAEFIRPGPGSIQDAPTPVVRPIPRDSSFIATLAAVLASWPGGTIPSGKDLEKAAQSVGLTISDDTIRKALDAAREVAPSLSPPK